VVSEEECASVDLREELGSHDATVLEAVAAAMARPGGGTSAALEAFLSHSEGARIEEDPVPNHIRDCSGGAGAPVSNDAASLELQHAPPNVGAYGEIPEIDMRSES